MGRFVNLPQRRSSRMSLLVAWAGLWLAAPASIAVAEAPAAESLAVVPEDAAFYSAMLRNREQVEMVAGSKFWKRLNEWQVVQQLRGFAEIGMQRQGGDWQQLLKWAEQPENQQLLAVLKEMFSDEVFLYGDQQVAGTMSLALGAFNSMRYAPMMHQLVGQESGLGENEFVAKVVLDQLADDLDNVAVPGLIMGFKVKDTDAAREQLRRLEAYTRVMLEGTPELAQLKDGFKTKRIGNEDYMTLTVPGKLVPWDEIPFADLEDNPGDYDALRKRLEELTIVVNMGLRGKYVLLSVGGSTEHLARLGQGDTLADHAKLAPLKDAGELRYTSVGYVSDAMMDALATKPEDLDDLVDLAESLLPLAEDLPEEMRERLIVDAQALAKDLKPFIPESGAQLNFSYLTDRGVETQHYNWTENKLLDGSRPLTLLEHLGGTPILAMVARTQRRPQDYELVVKWLVKARDYFEQLAVPEMSPDEREGYAAFQKVALPLLARIDSINREMLIPALADGQTAMVLDARVKSTQWTQHLPPTVEEIALPVPAIIFGVSDAELFGKALGELRGAVNDALAAAHELEPDDVPDVELPPARSRELPSGATVYYYRLPEQLGIYSQVAPNVAISEKAAILSLLPKQTIHLIEAQPLDVPAGPLADADRPLASATYFDWNATVDMVVPWINEGVRTYARYMQAEFDQLGIEVDGELNADGDSDVVREVLDNVNIAASLLKAFRGFSSVTYVQDGALVTHSEAHYQDLE